MKKHFLFPGRTKQAFWRGSHQKISRSSWALTHLFSALLTASLTPPLSTWTLMPLFIRCLFLFPVFILYFSLLSYSLSQVFSRLPGDQKKPEASRSSTWQPATLRLDWHHDSPAHTFASSQQYVQSSSSSQIQHLQLHLSDRLCLSSSCAEDQFRRPAFCRPPIPLQPIKRVSGCSPAPQGAVWGSERCR